ncbi:uncharacterized protein LOC134276564 [Saccostrea cucullata]|uniref:uncharacterized protein LOC134276564 n=1 Tax=Saccostrea cuccullata TaxID=36930 RepID=UPI002ED1A8FF
MPRKKNWRMGLVKMGNQSRGRSDNRLVDTSHVKNSTKDPTIDATIDGPLRLVEASHVKNSAKDWGDTASLKRVQDLPSGARYSANSPSGTRNNANSPSGTRNNANSPSGTLNSANMPLDTTCINNANLSSGSLNYTCLPSKLVNSDSLPLHSMTSNNVVFYSKDTDNFSLDLKKASESFSCPEQASCLSFIEKNLPVTKLFATINQASNLFPPFSRGVQCTCNALMSIILKSASTSAELDEVLFAADDLYRVRIAELQSTVQLVSKMLQFQELPKSVFVNDNQYEICYHEEIYGTVTHIDWDNSCQSNNLKAGIELLFRRFNQGLIIVGGLCSAIYVNDKNCPVFFDSHSHGEDGLSSADGRAIKITFSDIDQLVDYMFAFYQSCNISMTSQFEIQPVSVTQITSESNAGSKRPSLIDKYFDFQENMSKKCNTSDSPQENRNEYMRNYMRKRRENSLIKQKDRESNLRSMTKARQSKEFKEKELASKKIVRENPERKQKDRESNLRSMTKARKSKEFREKELASKQKNRENFQTKQKDRESTLQSMTKARQKKELASKQKSRENSETKQKDRESTLKSKTKSRQSTEFCLKEREAKKRKRDNVEQLEKERLCKQQSRKKYREKERENERVSKAKRRLDTEFKDNENKGVKKRCHGNSLEDCIEKFHEQVKIGPIYVCTCCHQTWFLKSVVKLDSTCLSATSKSICTGFRSVNDIEWLCLTCCSALKDEKIPKLSVKNGMKWPEKPDALNLHPLEERLISQRIPFMQIRELPRGGQMSVKGNVVNVPVDIQPTVNALPRQIDEHVTIAVKLKKRLSHKSACFTENVRPNVVIKALQWLMKNSELYKNSGIVIDHSWKDEIEQSNEETVQELIGSLNDCDDREIEGNDDGFCEITLDDCIQGNSDTLVDEADIDTNKLYVFAPGENQKPISLFTDKDAEYLCFPTIFCGQRRVENEEREVPVHYSDIAKWELRSVDRRAAQSVPNIFFKLKKIQIKQVSDKVNLALRRCKSEGKKITAEQVLNPASAEKIVRLNEGYYIFRTLRNSPAYLSSKKKDVFAMIRQLGLPTWFISLSSADTRWQDLLKTLAMLDGKSLSPEELEDLNWSDKSKLVKQDPVTCARFFDNRVQLFINTVLKSPHNPLGVVTDVFRRVEFQNRGSPHIHMLVWTSDAPKHKENSNEEIEAYVDKYVTCGLQENNSQMKCLVELQVHKHSKTCKKGGKSVCRFGFPLPPLPKTMLLEPLDVDVEHYRKLYSDIQKKMNDYKDGCSLDYESFLQTVVEMCEDEYIKCIRASLKGPKVFLRRSPSEMRVNYYNTSVLKAWNANLDIQFVLDPYACATYIVAYISKSQRGISAMLDKASQEAAEGNMDLKRQVRHIGNKFLNFVEVSAQEASYLILQMPLTQASREVVFINTSPPEDRVFLLKHQDELNELPKDSTDIKSDGMIQRYARRPKQLENWCLADVVSELEVTFPKEMEKDVREEVNDDDPELDSQQNIFSDQDVLVHLKNGIKIRRRKNKRVIRYVGYSQKTNSEQYYRERILLYLPWRNENTDLFGSCQTYEQHYMQKASIIQMKQRQYEHFVDELEQARLQAEEDLDDLETVAPNTEHAEAEDAEIGSEPSEEFVHFDPDTVQHRDFDIGPDLGLSSKVTETEMSAVRIPDEQYYKLLQSLNTKQREFYNHVTNWIQNREEPLYAFLTGGAGAGKSVVIDAIFQTLHRILYSKEGENPDDIRILLCAHTGKAAYNIKGTTIASAFHRKMYQTQQHMGADELNSFRTKYRNLSVVIIDEISMVGNNMLTFINDRLQQLTGRKQDFGGISIIAVGDLYQLPPVGDKWIFNDLSNPGQSLATNLWHEHFHMHELTEIMRQKDDLRFAEMLNRLRENKMTDEDKELISQRIIRQDSEIYPKQAPHLFIENKFVDCFNNNLIENLSTVKVNVRADTDVLSQTKLSASVKLKLVQNLPENPASTGQLRTNLVIAVDMLYDISVNLDVTDGLTNGASCVVKYIEYRQSRLRPAIVWVLFADSSIGISRRHQYNHLFSTNVNTTWTPIFEAKRTFVYNRKTYERVQFPLQPSAGKTIHKAQGATLSKAVISLAQTTQRKIPHIHYVALSRVRSLDGLFILDFNEKSLSKDENVDKEMERLRDNRLQLSYIPLYSVCKDVKFLFNNARSLHKHFFDIKSEPSVVAADVIGIAESWLCESDSDEDFTLEGFTMFRNDANISHTRSHHGIVIYLRNHLQCLTYNSFTSKSVEFSIISIKSSNTPIQCVVLYKQPSCTLQHFYDTLRNMLLPFVNKDEKIVMMGDCNLDLSTGQYGHFLNFMKENFGCEQVINKVTTKNKTQLDLIFTNFTDIQTDVLQAYWSDHNMIYCAANNP